MADPYTSKASEDATPQQKYEEITKIIASAPVGMLVTQSSNGTLHSRAMKPASTTGLVFDYIANKASGKFEEIHNNPNVNISYVDHKSSDWISISGTAKEIVDESRVKGFWNESHKAWFGDLGDGKHTGDAEDPRVEIIEVVPSEIRFWHATKGPVRRTADVAKAAASGETAAPGVLRVVSGEELEAFRRTQDR